MAEFIDGVHYLSEDDLIFINKSLIEAQTPSEPVCVLNPNNLSSSQSRPSLTRYYQQTDDMFVLAAALIESLIQNHPFANANKRTAMMGGYIFLLINGYELTAPGDDIVTMAEGLACKTYTCRELEDWLAYWSRTYDSRELCHPSDMSISDILQQRGGVNQP
ncbi:type II toxin-antitoxin system death-on-curing family toxin [Dickeya poaceiphila]|uniref:Type II toxin-antitoxin system death-on-curing family toxin n=1 Tax=Dickeya poaceiphila TaxID=568768 RepID=A0A5B8IAV9_9GAMM|nr:type II toxin-antitoxin system death-on-curing family toxin [Dickeya poaceiphila]QDX29570.1 type II toxin-antitoxin system death-on-curing family toxin [Dickeya poaceiphila]